MCVSVYVHVRRNNVDLRDFNSSFSVFYKKCLCNFWILRNSNLFFYHNNAHIRNPIAVMVQSFLSNYPQKIGCIQDFNSCDIFLLTWQNSDLQQLREYTKVNYISFRFFDTSFLLAISLRKSLYKRFS